MKVLVILLSSLILTACGSSSDSDFVVSGTGEVQYRISLQASWSSTTHPTGFPSKPHFSNLVGTVHTINKLYWQAGDLASAGIEQMAETGKTSSLVAEINTSISLGDSEKLILGDGISTSPGSRSFTISVNSSHPYLTLVTMLAPSPDWFIGVSAYNLMPAGVFIESDTVTLYAYDSGTDNGTNYTSANSDTNPQEMISIINSNPFLVNTTVVPVANLIIEKI